MGSCVRIRDSSFVASTNLDLVRSIYAGWAFSQ